MAAQAQSQQQGSQSPKNPVAVAAGMIQGYLERGKLHLPPGYSADNALKSAWLVLQATKTPESAGSKPVLEACTDDSIVNALLDMVVQGLSPTKKQVYFIPYGQTLSCQRSYMGTMAVAMRVDPEIEEITSEVVYEDDEFDYDIIRGRKVVTRHRQSLKNVDKKKIAAAYCEIHYRNGRSTTTVMTMEEIYQAWKQSRQKPFDQNGNLKQDTVHAKFPGEMCKRTVINRACKLAINSSDDSTLLQAANRSDDVATEHEVAEEIKQSANGQVIDIDPPAADPGPAALNAYEDPVDLFPFGRKQEREAVPVGGQEGPEF